MTLVSNGYDKSTICKALKIGQDLLNIYCVKMAKHTFIISDEAVVNSYGFRVMTAGIQLADFKKNPIVLWMHKRPMRWSESNDPDKEVFPIGTATNLRVENGKLLADIEFDEKDEFAAKIEQKVAGGIIRMASPGINPITVSDDKKYLLPGQTRATVVKSDLKEISIVDIGANKNALKLYNNNETIELSDGEDSVIPLIKLDFNDQNQNRKMNKELLNLLKLSDNSDESAVMAAVNNVLSERDTALGKVTTLEGEVATLKTEKQELETKLTADEAAKFQALIDDPKRKLTDDQKKTYLELFQANKEAASKAVSALPLYKNLSDLPDGKDAKKEERKTWTFTDWTKKDSKGLAEMKLNDQESYKVLFKAEYGVEPKL